MNCPSCNSKNAYVGFSTIECCSDKCKHFSSKLLEETYPAITIIVPEMLSIPSGLNTLLKALEAGGYDATPTELTQGCSLQIEDIELAMKDVEFKYEHIIFPKVTVPGEYKYCSTWMTAPDYTKMIIDDLI